MWPCVNTLSAVCVSRRRPSTCLWPDGSPKYVTIVLSVHQIGAQESKPNPASQKSTTLLWKWSFSYQKVFLAHFRGFVVWSIHVSKSSHPRIDRTLSVRRIVMSCFRPDESPKFGIVLRSSNRRSWDRRNHIVPESKPNPASPQLYFENEAFF